MNIRERKLVCGIGINDADYVVEVKETISYISGKQKMKVIWRCPFHKIWENMIKRCYSKWHQLNSPTYKDCTVCDEWLVFSNFKSWMEQQDWEGKHLDKDILFIGNKVYNPDRCVFVSRQVNNFITDNRSNRGNLLIGVSWKSDRQKFMASCNQFGNGQKFLGYFSNETDAHKAWLSEKRRLSKILASQQTDVRVAKAIIERYENYKFS